MKSLVSKKDISLFLSCWLVLIFFTEASPVFQTGQYRERFFEIVALVDHGTFAMDRYVGYLGHDQARYNNHVYSAHDPGMSFLLGPQYIFFGKPVFTIAKLMGWPEGPAFDISAWFVKVTSLALYQALSLLFLIRILSILGINKNAGRACCIAYLFGTWMFPYATFAVSDGFMPPFMMIAIWSLLESDPKIVKKDISRRKQLSFLAIAGLSLGIVTMVKASTALMCIPLGLYILWRFGFFGAVAFSAPITLCIGILLLHNKLVFDGWFNWSLNFYAPKGKALKFTDKNKLELFTWSRYSWGSLHEMLLSDRHGMLFVSPFLAWAIPGLILIGKRVSIPLALCFFGCAAVHFMFALGFVGWHAGACIGSRYFLPAIPYIAIPSLFFISSYWNKHKILKAIFILCITASVAFCFTSGISSVWMRPASKHAAHYLYSLEILGEYGPLWIFYSLVENKMLNWLSLLFPAVAFMPLYYFREVITESASNKA